MDLELKAQELKSTNMDIPVTLLTFKKLEKEPSVGDISKAIVNRMYFNYDGIMPFYCKYRGMALEQLESILKLIENPEESYVFWGDSSLGKAADYGGIPKLILCFDTKKCNRSYKEIEIAEHSEETIAKFKREYARFLESDDKSRLFFSHFDYDMNQVGYERNYGNYIPENVGQALKRIIVFGYEDDPELFENLKPLEIEIDQSKVNG
jgi:hypothetical protein